MEAADLYNRAHQGAAGPGHSIPDIESARLRERMDAHGACLRKLSRAGRLIVREDALRRYFADRREEGYPAVHHSERYRDAYAPAYRIVLPELLERAD